MAVFSPTGSASSGGSGGVTVASPAIQNVILTTADTEYTVVIPVGTKRFTIKSRQDAVMKLAYVATESGTNYWTVGYGVCYTERELDGTGITLYIQSSKDGTDLEVISWT